MSIIFKFLFERLTDPLGLPLDWVYEYIILSVIGLIAYHVAYNKVSDLYDGGWISGSTTGSFFHWVIRAFLFVVMWLALYGVIQIYYFVTANWQILLMTAGSVIGTILLCMFAVAMMRFVKKHRAVNSNA